ncbi:MAG: hypothetical protein FRX49_05528 [Trebouxia sp. A1-2]|nr:MAG: hypothetical protein FRX49_05528 [Trebouxia sp. A1-2]
MDLKLEGIYPKAQKYIDRDDTPRMTKCQRVESHDGTAWPKKEGKTFDPVLLLKLTALDETTKTNVIPTLEIQIQKRLGTATANSACLIKASQIGPGVQDHKLTGMSSAKQNSDATTHKPLRN